MGCCDGAGESCCSGGDSVQVVPEMTPNPMSLRFTVNRELIEGGGCNFTSAEKAKGSPLPDLLFALPGVSGVLVAKNFVTVTAQAGTDWNELCGKVEVAIKDHVESGQDAISPEAKPEASSRPTSEIEAGIVKVLEEEIRPAVSQDGGDVEYVGYQDGIVRLRLRGACHGCPSASITLKLGIEHRLKQQFEEILAVESV